MQEVEVAVGILWLELLLALVAVAARVQVMEPWQGLEVLLQQILEVVAAVEQLMAG
jgi:hypothetical protein